MQKQKFELLKTLFAAAGGLTLFYMAFGWAFYGRPVEAQGDMYVSRRLDMIEQRFYSLESRLNRIEQDSIVKRASPAPSILDARAQDISLLQSEVTGLRLRLGEVECSLLKLDERTLPAAKGAGAER